MFSLPLAVSAVAVLLTFAAAAVQDWKTRTVYRATWYPAAAVGTLCMVLFWKDALFVPGAWAVLFLSVFFAVLCAAFAFFGLFGKADAKALILLSLAVPVTPFAEWIFPSLSVSAVVNAGVLSLAVPVFCLLYNLIHKNRAPFWLLCSGYPVPGKEAVRHFGFLAEDIREEEGRIHRSFVSLYDSLTLLRRMPEKNTRNLRENPQEYAEMLRLCNSCETVWITVGIPLLVPLTAGLVLAMFGVSAADILLTLL